MLDWWLFPLLVVLGLVLWVLYMVMKHRGGSGIRTEGRTLVDKPDDDAPPFE
jgi:hypothetical protein